MLRRSIACGRRTGWFLPKKISKASHSSTSTHSVYLCISDEVEHALQTKKAVVALETTIVTHGMPYPENVEMAAAVEDVVRSNNAVPATIGLINGKICVGLDQKKLEYLASQANNVIKTSRRDMSYAVSQGFGGGTTVSGTMIAAYMAGISTFVTGGIGGVHRGAVESFDISADLTELARTPVAVVCAGIKSILDIELTLEYLETQGVPVVSYGTSREFPAFFTAKSGFEAPYCLDSPKKIADMIDCNEKMGLSNGIIIGVPIPEDNPQTGLEIEAAIQKAVEEARIKGIKGKHVTPFILQKVNELTKGKSLKANISLIKNNAKVGAAIAVELSKLKSEKRDGLKSRLQVTEDFKGNTRNDRTNIPLDKNHKRPVVIGGCNFDLLSKASSYDVLGEATNPGKLFQSFGGVGRNIADCLARLKSDPLLISAVGSDKAGDMILNDLQRYEVDTRGIMVVSEVPTACYSLVVNVAGDLVLGVGDMDIHELITPDYISDFIDDISNASIVCFDANLSFDAVECILKICAKAKVPVWFEPTCAEKARKPFQCDSWHAITFLSPNRNELRTINAAVENRQISHTFYTEELAIKEKQKDIVEECVRLSLPILEKVPFIMVTLGKFGVLVGTNWSLKHLGGILNPCPANKEESDNLKSQPQFFHYPAASPGHLLTNVVSVSGAGDSFAGAVIHGLLNSNDADLSIKFGLYAAYLSLKSHCAISEELKAELFTSSIIQSWAPWSCQEIYI